MSAPVCPVDSVSDQDAMPLRTPGRGAAVGYSWILGSIEVTLCLTLAIGLLARPGVLGVVYPRVVGAHGAADAVRIAEWLKSGHRERSLNLALTGGQMTPKELRHYSDVRRVLRWQAHVAMGLGGLLLLLVAIRWQRGGLKWVLTQAQYAGLVVWLVLLSVVAGFAWWDWKQFLAWVHLPLFGDRSWRFANHAYSLELFPTSFWRAMTMCVLLAPGLVLAVTAGFAVAAGKGRHPSGPTGKRPTTP